MNIHDFELIPPSSFRVEGYAEALLERVRATDEDERGELLAAFAARASSEWLLALASEAALEINDDPSEKASIISEIAARYWRLGRIEFSSRLFGMAAEACRECESHWQQAESIQKVARRYDQVGERQAAINLLFKGVEIARLGASGKNIQDALDAISVLGDLAVDLFLFGERESAKEISERISDPRVRRRTLLWITRMGNVTINDTGMGSSS